MPSQLKIILVDDDSDDHFLFRDAFVNLNLSAEIISFYNGNEILSYLKSTKSNSSATDIIIMDINMPNMNGLVTLAEIKKDPLIKHIPVYILSTTRTEPDYKKCLELGAVNFFTKPSNAKEFSVILREIFQAYINKNSAS